MLSFFYLCRFGKSRSSSGSTPSVCQSVHPQHVWGACLCLVWVICNSKNFHSFFQTLHIDCSHMKMCNSFLFTFHDFVLILVGLDLDIFPSKMHRGFLVCVICISKSFHFFLFELCMMIVHILKMCTFYFVYVSCFFFHFWGVLN